MKSLGPVLLVCLLAATAFAQQRPLPLDPLTPEERTRAEEIARADGRVREIAPNPEVDPERVQFTSAKVPDANGRVPAEPTNRYADVVVYDRERGAGARVLVDLTASRAINVIRLPDQLVPITSRDVELAAQIALRNDAMRERFGVAGAEWSVAHGPVTRARRGRNLIEGVRLVGRSHDDPCTIHRCIALFFRPAALDVARRARGPVVVDLTAQRLAPAEPGGGQ